MIAGWLLSAGPLALVDLDRVGVEFGVEFGDIGIAQGAVPVDAEGLFQVAQGIDQLCDRKGSGAGGVGCMGLCMFLWVGGVGGGRSPRKSCCLIVPFVF